MHQSSSHQFDFIFLAVSVLLFTAIEIFLEERSCRKFIRESSMESVVFRNIDAEGLRQRVNRHHAFVIVTGTLLIALGPWLHRLILETLSVKPALVKGRVEILADRYFFAAVWLAYHVMLLVRIRTKDFYLSDGHIVFPFRSKVALRGWSYDGIVDVLSDQTVIRLVFGTEGGKRHNQMHLRIYSNNYTFSDEGFRNWIKSIDT